MVMGLRRRTNMNLRWARVAVLALLTAVTLPAAAADAAGVVKRVQGAVTLQRAGQTLPVTAGTAVQVGDRLVTGGDGSVGLTMADDSQLTAGPASTLVISQFRFDSTTHDGNMLVELLKGTLHFVSGLIAKQAPQNVNVQTRNALMGVRGTEFIVDARGDTP
jgi:hypothetical protein